MLELALKIFSVGDLAFSLVYSIKVNIDDVNNKARLYVAWI